MNGKRACSRVNQKVTVMNQQYAPEATFINLSSGASSAWLRRLASRLRMNLHNRFQLFEFVVFLKFLKSDITNQQMVVYK